MKVAPLHRAFQERSAIESKVVHTGQHYDAKMSDIFFNQLELPEPHHYLGIGGGTHTQQTARIMLKFEEVMEVEKPDLMLVVGTSAAVHPAAGLIDVAHGTGARIVVVNPEAGTAAGIAAVEVLGKAGEVLPVLLG